MKEGFGSTRFVDPQHGTSTQKTDTARGQGNQHFRTDSPDAGPVSEQEERRLTLPSREPFQFTGRPTPSGPRGLSANPRETSANPRGTGATLRGTSQTPHGAHQTPKEEAAFSMPARKIHQTLAESLKAAREVLPSQQKGTTPPSESPPIQLVFPFGTYDAKETHMSEMSTSAVAMIADSSVTWCNTNLS